MAIKTTPDEESDATPIPSVASAKASWIPALVAIILSPVLTWSVAHFVLLPKLQASLQSGETHDEAPAAGHDEVEGTDGEETETETSKGYRIENIVVNLAGTMGTRYLKTSFLITGKHPELIAKFDAARPQIGDVTLAVLSGLTLADLEEPGSKNIIRERLVDAYNQVFGGKVAENLYFSDFVVQ